MTENIVAAFLHIFDDDAIGPASQDLLRMSLRALMDVPDTTLLGITAMIDDSRFRERIAAQVTDPLVARYWHMTVPGYTERAWEDIQRPIMNKLRRVLGDPRVRNMVGQTRSTFNLRRLMDEGGILIANLSVGTLGAGTAHLIGALLSASLASTAFGRVDIPEAHRRPFLLYIDEFQMFANSAYIDILSGARKFGLLLTLAHQFIGQLPPELADAVFGNAGTTIAFRLGADDSLRVAANVGLDEMFREAQLKGHQQLTALPNFAAFVRLLEAGAPATWRLTGDGPPLPRHARVEKLKAHSARNFGRDRDVIEDRIRRFYQPRLR